MTLSMEQYLTTDDSQSVVYGYRKSRWRTVVTYTLSCMFIGLPFLVFHWLPTWLLYATCVRCSFQIADRVLVVETYQKKCKSYYIHLILHKDIADTSGLLNEGFDDDGIKEKGPIESADAIHTPIHLDDGSTLNVQHYRYFRHKKQSLIWDGARAQWSRLAGIESGATCAQLQAMGATPPSSERRVRMLNIYGLNEIKVPVQSVMTLIILEVFNPFYVFQLFTIAVWLAEPYYYYCIAVVLMSTFGVATSVIQTKKNQTNLRATVEAHDTVELWDGRRVDSRCVSPGDIIVLPPRGCILHFDAALLSGAAVLNESMLTGESVPVTKTALLRVDRPFDLKEHASSVLFCGTRVIQTRYYNNEPVKALVLRTGYNTSKGQLVRSILYPVPADFKFDRDSYKFIIILACIAVLGLAYTVALKAYRSLRPGDIAIKALDIITIVIPPALPAAMTVGRLYAVSRLKRARIACLNTRAVNVSGSLDCVCFDKTGTLTEDGLDMWGIVAVSGATNPPRLGRPQRDPRQLNELHPLKMAMASCHSLTLLDSELAGDPLDLKMFESTGWVLEEPDIPEASNYEILTPTIVKPKKTANIDVDDIHLPLEVGIVQQHQFVSSLQRSSVVTRVLGEDVLRLYTKGAPEMLRKLCTPDTAHPQLPLEVGIVQQHQFVSSLQRSSVVTRVLGEDVLRLYTKGAPEMLRKLCTPDTAHPQLPLEVGIVQQHQFVSSLQRSSVVTRVLGEDVLRLYTKGAPEMLRKLCTPDTAHPQLPLEVGIVQQHQFVSSLQRSSVVTRVLGEDVLRLYTKGAPEMLRKLCTPDTAHPQLPLEVGIVQQHQFVSSLQRSSVVTRVLGEDVLRLYTKGAPEMLRKLCTPDTAHPQLPLEVGIVQQHQFVSSLQRSSVVTRVLGEDVLRLYTKGAPEMLRKLCTPDTAHPQLPLEVGIVQQHQFVSSLQRSSVVTRVLGEDVLRLYTKGAPEMLRKLCTPDTAHPQLPLEVGIVQQHQFVSSLQRSSVVTRVLGEDVLRLYTKGAPEMLRKLCTPDTAHPQLPLEVGIVQQHQFVSSLQRSSVVTRVLGEDVLRLYTKGAPEMLRKLCTPDTAHPQLPLEVGIVQQHQFVSSLQRSSVVTRVLGEDVLRLYTKGAPEMLRKLCTPDTVPDNLYEVLNSYAEKGYRVIAVATRVMETTFKQLQKMTREEVERDLEFLGLVIMENRLKAATTGIIRELKEANIHVVMITGDNVLTAVSVAKECGILMGEERVVTLMADTSGTTPVIYCESTLHGASVGRRFPLDREWRSVDSGRGSWRSASADRSGHSALTAQPPDGFYDPEAGSNEPRYKIVMTGDTWKVLREHYPNVLSRVVARGAVFARMTSDQKQQLIVEYQALGYYVGMCGDGANDCGALRAAHTGISLSELESSVAAPFTSAHPDIVCVARVLREGRAALSTSFGVFKFMVAYSLSEFFSVAFLYYFDSNLTDFQFLYIDVALIVNFAFFFGMTEAYTGCNTSKTMSKVIKLLSRAFHDLSNVASMRPTRCDTVPAQIRARHNPCGGRRGGGSKKAITMQNLNPNIIKLEYAVRGPLVIRAMELEKELAKGASKPFKTVIKANIGDAHAMGQKPITFIRQVLACVCYPQLLNNDKFPSDVKARARDLLAGCGGKSVGSYTASYGIEMIRRHVAEYIECRDGHPCNWENCLLVGGASSGIKNCLQMLINKVDGKGTGVLIPIPQYPLYSASLAEYGLAQIGYFLDEESNWALNVSELERAFKEGSKKYAVRAIVVINPGNPTGQVLTRKNIEMIIKFAQKKNLFLMADEVYQDNIYDKNSCFHSFKKVMMDMGAPYKDMELASFMSISKGYMGECGLRGGWMELVNLDPGVKANLLKAISAMLCPTTVGQAAADCVARPPMDGEPSFELWCKEKTAVLDSLEERSRMIVETFNKMEGFKCNIVQGAMYAFPRIQLPPKAIEAAKKAKAVPDAFYARTLLEETGICIVPGSGFGQKPGTYHFRTTILPQPKLLKEMLQHFSKFHQKFIKKYG
uniref:Cation-transporting ATPase n=1 Tax=Heliothis virescens TaxID=7102 RepID=A0A2A4JKB6_HELVI